MIVLRKLQNKGFMLKFAENKRGGKMYIQEKDVEYKGEYILKCTFSDGAVKNVDISPLLDAPVFQPLKDVAKFKQFGLDETIFWANGADIAPEWLYSHGEFCKQ